MIGFSEQENIALKHFHVPKFKDGIFVLPPPPPPFFSPPIIYDTNEMYQYLLHKLYKYFKYVS